MTGALFKEARYTFGGLIHDSCLSRIGLAKISFARHFSIMDTGGVNHPGFPSRPNASCWDPAGDVIFRQRFPKEFKMEAI